MAAPDENLDEWVRAGVVQGRRALDIGCGNGRNAIYLARHGFAVDAVDQSVSAVRWAREEVGRAGLPVSVHCESIFDFELQPGSYDFVYDSGCFHHLAPHQRAGYVQLVCGALKPGGAFGLVCFTPAGGNDFTDDEVYERGSLGWGLGYDEHRLRALWGTAFDIRVFRPMRDQPAEAGLFGKDFLWTMLGRRR